MLYLIFLILLAVLATTISVGLKKTQWTGVSSGMEVDLVHEAGVLKLFVEGQQVAAQFKLLFSVEATLKSERYGTIVFREQLNYQKGQQRNFIQMTLLKETVLLEPIPTNWAGRPILSERTALVEGKKSQEDLDFEDERWQMTAQLLDLIRENCGDPEFISTGLQIEGQLRRFFLIQHRIKETQDLLDQHEQKELSSLLETNNERIEERLQALKRLHVLSLSKEVNSTSDHSWEDVQASLKRLVIEQRLDHPE